MRVRDRRISQLKRAIAAAPVQAHLLREAYEWFTEWGEFSGEDDSIAYAVVLQAMNGGKDAVRTDHDLHPSKRPSLASRVRKVLDERWPPSVRAMLFAEALFERDPLSRLARGAIAVEVAYGGDVESDAFGARHGVPTYGSVAMHVAGYPKRLVLPPYEDQATRLLVRQDNLRGRIPHDDPRWFEVQAQAVETFLRTGELPDDDLHADVVLVNVEMDQLVAHKAGKKVSKAMKLLDRVARGDKAEGALKALCAMAAAGELC